MRKSVMRKGISPQKIAYLIFALAAVVVLLAIYLNYYTKSNGGMFCTIYGSIYYLLPSGDEPPPLPRSCIQETLPEIDTTQISAKDKIDVENQMVEYIIGCYQSNKARGNLTMPCYNLKIAALSGEISETDITRNMAESGFICSGFENSKVKDIEGKTIEYSSIDPRGCGTKDQIIWNVHKNIIKKGDIVEIKYSNRTVKVIA